MANPRRGEVTITIKGTEHTLVPSFAALEEFEDKTGKTPYEALADFSTMRLSFRVCAAILWAGIRGGLEDKREAPSYDHCGTLVQSHGLSEFMPTAMHWLKNAVSSDEDLEAIRQMAGNESAGEETPSPATSST